MADKPWDHQGEAHRALETIVRDPQYGAAALSKPAVVSNLLKDLLPDHPREASLLVAAAQADLAGTLRRYVDQGLDLRTATSLTVASFVDSTSHTAEACSWVASELALVLGLGQPTVGPGLITPSETRQQSDTARRERTDLKATDQRPLAPSASGDPMQSGLSRQASLSAALVGCAAAYFLLLACIAPYAQFPGESSRSILTGVHDEPASEIFWLAIDPVGMLVVTIGSIILLLAPKRLPSLGRLLPGVLMAFGVQAILLFAGFAFAATPPERHEVGGFLGLLGGAALLAAGVMSSASGTPIPADATSSAATITGRRLIIALGASGFAAIIASLLWLLGAAPGFLNAGSAAVATSHHAYRGIAAAVGGAGAILGAWLLRRQQARQSERAVAEEAI
jgi:hypothetical protein